MTDESELQPINDTDIAATLRGEWVAAVAYYRITTNQGPIILLMPRKLDANENQMFLDWLDFIHTQRQDPHWILKPAKEENTKESLP